MEGGRAIHRPGYYTHPFQISLPWKFSEAELHEISKLSGQRLLESESVIFKRWQDVTKKSHTLITILTICTYTRLHWSIASLVSYEAQGLAWTRRLKMSSEPSLRILWVGIWPYTSYYRIKEGWRQDQGQPRKSSIKWEASNAQRTELAKWSIL